MALSGNISTAYRGWTYQISWSATQSVTENTSTIVCVHKLICDSNYALNIGKRENTCTVDGETKTFTSPAIYTGGSETITLGTTTHTVKHNNDGTRSCNISGVFNIQATLSGLYKATITASEAITLTTIARASQPSCITYPNHTQDVGEFGDTISIHMNRNSSAFTHTVRYAFGDASGTCINAETGKAATGIETGFKWKIPESLMDLIPANTSGSGTIYVDTYNGSTKIGTKSCGFTATVPASVKPSCSFVLDDITKVDETYGSPVKGLSKIKITVSSVLARSSPIASCKITANGVTYSGTTATTDFLKTAGTSRVTATVTDKRGRTGTASYDMSVQDYSPPKITQFTLHRCTEDGLTSTNTGGYVRCDFGYSVSDMNGKNTGKCHIYYQKAGASSFTLVHTETKNSNSSWVHFEADGDYAYNIKIVVQDNHHLGDNSVSRTSNVSTAFTLQNFHESGTGIRFGGVAEEKNTFQNDLIFIQRANQYCFSSVGAASTDGYILMARITITETNSDTPLTFVFSRRKAAAPMTVHICFNSTADTDPALQSIRYEGENYDAYITKSAASVWDLYVKKVSNSDTVTMNRWHTSYRQMKRCKVDFIGSIVSQVPTGLVGYYKATPLVAQSIIDCIMPVGFILTLYSNTANPNTMYPGTVWVRIENAFLWGCDSNGTIGQTGGSKTHTLTVNELPAHSHGSVYSQHADGTKDKAWYTTSGTSVAYGAVSTGDGAAHNNMPPYIQVAIWRRTA